MEVGGGNGMLEGRGAPRGRGTFGERRGIPRASSNFVECRGPPRGTGTFEEDRGFDGLPSGWKPPVLTSANRGVFAPPPKPQSPVDNEYIEKVLRNVKILGAKEHITPFENPTTRRSPTLPSTPWRRRGGPRYAPVANEIQNVRVGIRPSRPLLELEDDNNNGSQSSTFKPVEKKMPAPDMVPNGRPSEGGFCDSFSRMMKEAKKDLRKEAAEPVAPQKGLRNESAFYDSFSRMMKQPKKSNGEAAKPVAPQNGPVAPKNGPVAPQNGLRHESDFLDSFSRMMKQSKKNGEEAVEHVAPRNGPLNEGGCFSSFSRMMENMKKHGGGAAQPGF
uniref:Uncharacterized protein n=1 Tax=Steinernema glaseri TaxID=37863 RepID=A0A1I8A9Y5_9BILA